MTHVLLWDGAANTLEVATVDEMLSRNRRAYADDLFPCAVPLMAGPSADMHAALESCRQTMVARQAAASKARRAIRRAMNPTA